MDIFLFSSLFMIYVQYSSLILECNTPAVVAFVGADDSVHHREHVPESETAD